MAIISRITQYASLNALNEFNEIGVSTVGIGSTGNFNCYEFNENVGINTIVLNTYQAYDITYDEFGMVLYGPGNGTYMRQYSDAKVVIYNELNEFQLTPTIVFSPSALSVNEGGTINFSIATTNIEDNIPLYYEIVTPSPTVILSQPATSLRSGNSISFNATTVNVGNGTTLSYDIVGNVVSSDFTDNSLTGITTVTGGVINTITKTTTGSGNKTFAINLRIGGNIILTSSTITITPAALYDFTSAVFTPGGVTGRDGPTLSQAKSGLTGTGVDAWKNDTAFFNVTTGIQYWTVPATGTYSIEAFGAQGGSGGSQIGGKGVRMSGNFTLTEGEIIRILVGQKGETGGHSQNLGSTFISAGGGGTFVVRTPYNTNGSILVVAGGGGGSSTYVPSDGRGGLTTNDGNTGAGGVSGGTNGNGGGGGDNSGSGPGGAGFLGNGVVDPPNGGTAGDVSKSFINGGKGGRNSRSWGGPEIYGGFGGGGGGGGLAAGGGGGYSGGGGGTWYSPHAGGGGGSYNNGSSQSNQVDSKTGDGQVTITKV